MHTSQIHLRTQKLRESGKQRYINGHYRKDSAFWHMTQKCNLFLYRKCCFTQKNTLYEENSYIKKNDSYSLVIYKTNKNPNQNQIQAIKEFQRNKAM